MLGMDHGTDFPRTAATTMRRKPERGSYSRDAAYAILDEGVVAHVGIAVDGDPIVIDVPNRKLDVLVDEASMARRREGWKPMDPRYTSGFLAKYAKLVQSASRGAITNVG